LLPIKHKSLPRHVDTREGLKYVKTDKPDIRNCSWKWFAAKL
jgi:hypothetical protein